VALGGRRAVFLDKDGTLVDNVPYSADVDRIALSRGAAEALHELHHDGFWMIVVSNQSGVARGLFHEGALAAVERRLRSLLEAAGVPLLDFVYCPHHPQGTVARYARECGCRKPRPGLIAGAAAKHGVDLTRSWMIGDILDDVEAGRRAGCRTALVDTGNETEWVRGPEREPDLVAGDLLEAARCILAADRNERADR
jgi:D-glycero-D-manno-heptose 1,7-bisphosphate phosphatase